MGHFVEGYRPHCVCPRGYQESACVREGMKNRNSVKRCVCTCVREQKSVCMFVYMKETQKGRDRDTNGYVCVLLEI